MARLHESPSQPAASPESATQELHAESLASQVPASPPSLSSAAHGASLLNAARFSKPSNVTRAAKGKLPRPSLKFGTKAKKPVNRANPYDIPDSPVKGSFQLPEKVNPAPLKVRGRAKKTREDLENHSQALSKLQEPHHELATYAGDEHEQQRSTPPPALAENTDSDVHVEEHPIDGRKRALEDEVESRDRTSKSPRLRELDATVFSNHQKAFSSPLTQPHVSRPSRRSHPEVHIPLRETRVHVPPANVGASDEHSNSSHHKDGGNQNKSKNPSTRVSGSISGPARSTRSSQGKDTSVSTPYEDSVQETIDHTAVPVDGDNSNDIDADEIFEIQQELEGDKQNGKIARSRRAPISTSGPSASSKHKKTKHTSAPKALIRASQRVAKNIEQPNNHDAYDTEQGSASKEYEGNDAEEAAELEEDANLTDLDRVFMFLDAEERPGQCETKLGTQIKHVCDRACSLISEENDLIDVVVENGNDIRAMLGKIDSIGENNQVAFKSDAYSYLFRALTLHFEAAYGYLSKLYDEVTESLPAIRILYSLVDDILTFKDWLASWNAPVPQHQKGDRLIRDVQTKLIAPLRKMREVFRLRMRVLETAEKRLQIRSELEHQRDEELARQDYLAARKERRKRWQDLHIARMQCEPDLYKRRKLFFVELDDSEIDANGEKFERIPLFKDRVTPRVSLLAPEREWADEQTAILIGGLEKFAGPRVFEKLFHTHCRPDGMLRDFTVTDITAKAAWVRSAYLKLHQEQQHKGWEVPGWVKQIPILP